MKQVKIISIEKATHDVLHIRTEKPAGINFLPGQAADVSLNKPSYENELRAFTFTSLPSDNYLEFFIKTYPSHKGVTDQMLNLTSGDSLFIGDVFGDIHYKKEGVFIAAGAGITPFLAIFKALNKQDKLQQNKLLFANKTAGDIIQYDYLNQLLGANFVNVLSEEKKEGFLHGYITKEIIQSQIENKDCTFYLCGPPPMMDAVIVQLKELGVNDIDIVKEPF